MQVMPPQPQADGLGPQMVLALRFTQSWSVVQDSQVFVPVLQIGLVGSEQSLLIVHSTHTPSIFLQAGFGAPQSPFD